MQFNHIRIIFKLFILLALSLSVTACNRDLPIGAYIYVPFKTLDRLGIGDKIGIAMMKDSACKEQYKLSYVGPGGYGSKTFTVGRSGMLPEYKRMQVVNKFYFCINEGKKWENVWEGKFNPDVAYMNFYCNKKDSQSRWQCIACGLCKNKQKEITEILSMY